MNSTYVSERIRYILKAPFKRCRDPHLPDWPPSEFHRRQMLMLNFHFPSFSLLSPGTLSIFPPFPSCLLEPYHLPLAKPGIYSNRYSARPSLITVLFAFSLSSVSLQSHASRVFSVGDQILRRKLPYLVTNLRSAPVTRCTVLNKWAFKGREKRKWAITAIDLGSPRRQVAGGQGLC